MYESRGFLVATNREPMATAVCAPIMQRVLRTLPRRTALYIDSSASVDQTNSSLTFVLAPTKAGAVPVGMIIHDSQSEASYTTGFKLLRQLWQQIDSDPDIENFMTDDSSAMRNALEIVFPGVRQLLCQFHVSQALWRWLFDSKNGIAKDDRQFLMDAFKKIMYAISEHDAEKQYQTLMSSDVASKYANFKRHLSNIFEQLVAAKFKDQVDH
ncbi:hypothetical protein B566_EDAN019085 [Ephemera danica]|nr:hypothetical protein B566_EDAN019085 [Ephemera danica]